MRSQDIKIGNIYRHRTSPNYAYAKAIEIIKPSKLKFASDIQKEIKCVVVKCEWTISPNDGYGLIKYFRPCDLIKCETITAYNTR
jgi:hypothetical protein